MIVSEAIEMEAMQMSLHNPPACARLRLLAAEVRVLEARCGLWTEDDVADPKPRTEPTADILPFTPRSG